MMDEVDKIGHDFRGDPAAALLEVLDPEQNNTFADHYLEIPYDLSNVMFVATANIADPIPPPLRDRMEILEIPGYTRREKLAIARQHLIPKQLEEHGITKEQLDITDKAVDLDHRPLHARGGRPHARASDRQHHPRRRREDRRGRHDAAQGRRRGPGARVPRAPQKYTSEVAERTEEAGVATGLAWTSVGGEILFIEATRMYGTGKLQLTGQLGDVMKESAQAALSLRAHERRAVRHQQGLPREERHPHPHPRGRHAEGRAERRRHDVHGARLDAHGHPRPARRGDDRRDHAARSGAADRRPQGEGARGAPRGHQAGASSPSATRPTSTRCRPR